MRRDVFDAIFQRGGLFIFWDPQLSWPLERFLSWKESGSELPGSVLILDMDRRYPDTAMLDVNLFTKRLGSDPDRGALARLPADKVVALSLLVIPDAVSPDSLRFFLYNLQWLRESYPFIVLIVPRNLPEWVSALEVSCVAVIAPPHERVPFKQSAKISLDQSASQILGAMLEHLRVRILARNPVSGWRWLVLRGWWFVALAIALVVLGVPVVLDHPVSLLRSLDAERRLFEGKPFVAFQFDGRTPIQRLARHAIGRYSALVSSEQDIKEYVREVLNKNPGTDTARWKRDASGNWFPDSGTVLRFYPPERIFSVQTDSLLPAWRFYTGLLTDTLAYVTEYYNASGVGGRRHLGMDVAGRHGSRILAPYDGKAWTFRDERGGEVIAIAQHEFVILYMHCDQLLYLDGQSVFTGDPVATVGTTGHTTGPHVHIATGVISARGAYSAGPLRYEMIDPVLWFYRYSLKMRE